MMLKKNKKRIIIKLPSTWIQSGRSTSVKSRLKHNGGKYDAKNAPNPRQF